MAESVTDASERKLKEAAAAKLKNESEARLKAAGASEKSETLKAEK